SAVASAPVSAPATGSGTREGAIARDADPAPAAPAPESSAVSAAPPTRASAAGGEGGGESLHVVQRGETLSAIASDAAAAGANTSRTRSFMVAIYQANPRAFEKNMNVLHSGAVLRIPDAPQAAPPPVAEEKPSPPAEAPPPLSAEPAPAHAPTPALPAAGGSLVDTLLGYWWAIALLLVVLVAFAASRIIRARRAAQFDDSL